MKFLFVQLTINSFNSSSSVIKLFRILGRTKDTFESKLNNPDTKVSLKFNCISWSKKLLVGFDVQLLHCSKPLKLTHSIFKS